MQKQPLYVGIDGCRAGWVVATINSQSELSFAQLTRLEEIAGIAASVIFIDMPLSFAEDGYRACEVAAQQLLGKKRASIFMTPHRQAVYAETYAEANQLNKTLIGKGVSKQAWNICRKIKEAVAFSELNADLSIYEAHPELCFYFLNGQQPLLSKKASPHGIQDRLNIITSLSPQYQQAIEQFVQQTKRGAVKTDDVLDAAVLAIRASSPPFQKVSGSKDESDRNSIFF